MKIVSLEGNIGSGKTTLFQLLQAQRPDWLFVKEPVDLWTLPLDAEMEPQTSMLGHFQENPKEHAFAFQMQALATRVKELQQAVTNAHENATLICERSYLTDFLIFYKLQEKSFNCVQREAYKNVQDAITRDLRIDCILQLRCSPSECADRILSRGRSEERSISLDYLSELHDAHESMQTNVPIQIFESKDKPEEICKSVLSFLETYDSNCDYALGRN